ncbi:hypothetical protein BGW38_004341 [Lunasporangiospora selenospora]|uniref:Uncharacterized protein n=1 Tax=Lunasporangiospora selenospora TaxID=979761 RepID=A0A9P6FPF5_9FUNG|nr:hypothetical protein BGW38_004341 [Lunasporangiospora selenospora]
MRAQSMVSISTALAVLASLATDHLAQLPLSLDTLQEPCLAAVQDALCLLEFPKCKDGSEASLPVCLSVRDHVLKACSSRPVANDLTTVEPKARAEHHIPDATLALIREKLFSTSFESRWALQDSIQEPDCVSFLDPAFGATTTTANVIGQETQEPVGDLEENVTGSGQLESEDSFLTEEESDEIVLKSLEARHLSRRERTSRHHHHHHRGQKQHRQKVQSEDHHHHRQKRDHNGDEDAAESDPLQAEAETLVSRADSSPGQGQAVYAVSGEGATGSSAHPIVVAGTKEQGKETVLLHETLGHSETVKSGEGQRVLIQGGAGPADPNASFEVIEKAGEGHPKDTAETSAAEKEETEKGHPRKETVLLASVPILLLMVAVAGFTAYRRYYENSFNQGGRNDTRDYLPGDGYFGRDVPIRKGSPIHFDRTFLNTSYSPPPSATFLSDHEGPNRLGSPGSVASGHNMRRPPPSAGSHGKTRFQELSRSYDFGASLRSLKNALTRSNNSSRDGALDQAGSYSNNSLHGKNINQPFGSGGHSIAKIGSHPGLSTLERQQLQQQFGSASSASSGSRFPDISPHSAREPSIIWGQYSASDGSMYQDAAAAVASNLYKKSSSSNSLSKIRSGKYTHHLQQSSSHEPVTPTDSIGDCLAPESPSMTREEMMRSQILYPVEYGFGYDDSTSDDAHSGADLLFDAQDHDYDVALDKTKDEDLDMYLEMEKEESPFVENDYSTAAPQPYEPRIKYRDALGDSPIQKSASAKSEDEALDEKVAMAATEAQEEEEQRQQVQELGGRGEVAKQAEYDEKSIAVGEHDDDEPTGVEATHVLGSASPEWSQANAFKHAQGQGKKKGGAKAKAKKGRKH